MRELTMQIDDFEFDGQACAITLLLEYEMEAAELGWDECPPHHGGPVDVRVKVVTTKIDGIFCRAHHAGSRIVQRAIDRQLAEPHSRLLERICRYIEANECGNSAYVPEEDERL